MQTGDTHPNLVLGDDPERVIHPRRQVNDGVVLRVVHGYRGDPLVGVKGRVVLDSEVVDGSVVFDTLDPLQLCSVLKAAVDLHACWGVGTRWIRNVGYYE